MHAITVQAEKTAAPDQVHGLSLHPKVQAVIRAGLDKEWSSKEIAELLDVDIRSVQAALAAGVFRSSNYPLHAGGTSLRPRRRALGISLLTYILEHSDEITEADVVSGLKKALPLLTAGMLRGVITACEALIAQRGTTPVVVRKRPANVIPAHAEFSFVAALQSAAPAAEA